MSIENTIELLWNCSIAIQNDQQTHILLKSYYINTCRKLAKSNLQIPKEKFAPSQMCAHCGSFWNDIEYGLKVKPKLIKNSSKARKLIQNLEQSKSTTSKVLNRRQRNRAKWLKKKISNNLSIKCGLCKRSSSLKMENPKCQSLGHGSNTVDENVTLANYTKNISKIYKQELNDVNSISKDQENQISLLTSSTLKKDKQKKKYPTTLQSKNKEKLKNTATNKVISKTQKQNSLLQLSALLQKQSNIDKKSAQNRLQTFLK